MLTLDSLLNAFKKWNWTLQKRLQMVLYEKFWFDIYLMQWQFQELLKYF